MDELENTIKESIDLWGQYGKLIVEVFGFRSAGSNPFLIEVEPLMRVLNTGDITQIQKFNSFVRSQISLLNEAKENR